MLFTAGAVTTEDEYYLYYTSISRNWPEGIGIGVATSSDGIHWEQGSNEPLVSTAEKF